MTINLDSASLQTWLQSGAPVAHKYFVALGLYEVANWYRARHASGSGSLPALVANILYGYLKAVPGLGTALQYVGASSATAFAAARAPQDPK